MWPWPLGVPQNVFRACFQATHGRFDTAYAPKTITVGLFWDQKEGPIGPETNFPTMPWAIGGAKPRASARLRPARSIHLAYTLHAPRTHTVEPSWDQNRGQKWPQNVFSNLAPGSLGSTWGHVLLAALASVLGRFDKRAENDPR